MELRCLRCPAVFPVAMAWEKPLIKGAGLLCLVTIATAPSAQSLSTVAASEATPIVAEPSSEPPASIRVMTYNVHGLPTLLRKSGTGSLQEIGDKFRHLRASGRQPQIVVLQEAFTAEAKAIGRMGGYAYVVDGPVSHHTERTIPRFGSEHWWAGEGWGKPVDSGLQVLSDFPIVATTRKAFPEGACAGFDCLASKGILSVSVRVPGQTEPLEIVTTHLNSRKASGVSHARANAAFGRQTTVLMDFLRQTSDPRRPRILAGDFNIGRTPARRRMFRESLSRLGAPHRFGDALEFLAEREPHALPECVNEARERGKDLELWSDGTSWGLEPVRAEAPFGHEPDGSMLSDHVGYQTEFLVKSWPNGHAQ